MGIKQATSQVFIYTSLRPYKCTCAGFIYIIPGGPKKISTKLLVTILVAWQLLSGFNITHLMLCDCVNKETVYYCCVSQTPQRDNRVKISALLRAGHEVSEVANLVGVPSTTVYAICVEYVTSSHIQKQKKISLETIAICYGSNLKLPGERCVHRLKNTNRYFTLSNKV